MTRNNPKIFLCDDEQSILDVLEMILEPEGYEIIAESDSTKAIQKIINEKPDVIMLDLWMPVLSGYSILESIRSNPDIGDIPVIVLSASMHEEGMARKAGATKFIQKPFDLNDIIISVNSCLEI